MTAEICGEGMGHRCSTGPNFPAFPYAEPYEVQKDFMRELYTAISQSSIGLFESPTGRHMQAQSKRASSDLSTA